VLTFDDGYRDFYTHAFPVLRQCGFAATVFLPTDFIGNGRPGLCCKEHLIWEEVRELAGQGITFGSHTHTHPQLKGLSRSAIVQELRRSRNIIEDKLGSAVTEFSYPYRFPEENVEFKKFFVGELTKAGYICGVTTSIGRYRAGDDAIFIKRLPVNSDDDKAFLEAKLKGNYDWLHTPQYLVKRVRSRVR
jgi:hypothetical protein